MAEPLGRQPQSRRSHPLRGGGRRLSRFPRPVPHFVRCSYHRMHPIGADAYIGPHTAPSYPAPRRGRTAPRGSGAGTLSDTVRHKAAVHHPLTGWGRRSSALPGIAPSADGAMDDWGFRAVRGAGFRPLRRAGVSRRARRDQRPCLWTPRFFEKNRVKLLYYCSRSD